MPLPSWCCCGAVDERPRRRRTPLGAGETPTLGRTRSLSRQLSLTSEAAVPKLFSESLADRQSGCGVRDFGTVREAVATFDTLNGLPEPTTCSSAFAGVGAAPVVSPSALLGLADRLVCGTGLHVCDTPYFQQPLFMTAIDDDVAGVIAARGHVDSALVEAADRSDGAESVERLARCVDAVLRPVVEAVIAKMDEPHVSYRSAMESVERNLFAPNGQQPINADAWARAGSSSKELRQRPPFDKFVAAVRFGLRLLLLAAGGATALAGCVGRFGIPSLPAVSRLMGWAERRLFSATGPWRTGADDHALLFETRQELRRIGAVLRWVGVMPPLSADASRARPSAEDFEPMTFLRQLPHHVLCPRGRAFLLRVESELCHARWGVFETYVSDTADSRTASRRGSLRGHVSPAPPPQEVGIKRVVLLPSVGALCTVGCMVACLRRHHLLGMDLPMPSMLARDTHTSMLGLHTLYRPAKGDDVTKEIHIDDGPAAGSDLEAGGGDEGESPRSPLQSPVAGPEGDWDGGTPPCGEKEVHETHRNKAVVEGDAIRTLLLRLGPLFTGGDSTEVPLGDHFAVAEWTHDDDGGALSAGPARGVLQLRQPRGSQWVNSVHAGDALEIDGVRFGVTAVDVGTAMREVASPGLFSMAHPDTNAPHLDVHVTAEPGPGPARRPSEPADSFCSHEALSVGASVGPLSPHRSPSVGSDRMSPPAASKYAAPGARGGFPAPDLIARGCVVLHRRGEPCFTRMVSRAIGGQELTINPAFARFHRGDDEDADEADTWCGGRSWATSAVDAPDTAGTQVPMAMSIHSLAGLKSPTTPPHSGRTRIKSTTTTTTATGGTASDVDTPPPLPGGAEAESPASAKAEDAMRAVVHSLLQRQRDSADLAEVRREFYTLGWAIGVGLTHGLVGCLRSLPLPTLLFRVLKAYRSLPPEHDEGSGPGSTPPPPSHLPAGGQRDFALSITTAEGRSGRPREVVRYTLRFTPTVCDLLELNADHADEVQRVREMSPDELQLYADARGMPPPLTRDRVVFRALVAPNVLPGWQRYMTDAVFLGLLDTGVTQSLLWRLAPPLQIRELLCGPSDASDTW